MIAKYSNKLSLVQVVLVVLLAVALRLNHTSLVILLTGAVWYVGHKNSGSGGAAKEAAKEHLENKLYAREFYPMPSPEENGDIRRIKRALKLLTPLRLNFNKKANLK